MEEASTLLEKRRKKIEELKNSGINLFPNDFKVKHTVADVWKAIEASPEEMTEESPEFVVAGRMMAVNRFGKASFIRFRDRTGQMQAYIRKDKIGEEDYQLFKKLDIGDYVGLTGGAFQTKTGEWTLLARKFRLLSKSYRPLPEKFHGLKDPEKRYRQRYLDLIMNPEVQTVFRKRSEIIQAVRDFLLERDFLEVETPMMQTIPGGAEAEPFVTHHKALDMKLYLRIAPELYLKRLVVGGLDRVFEINRNFRNEGVSTQHNPEFTMLEFYLAYATYSDLMDLTEEMMSYVCERVNGTTRLVYQGNEIELSKKWKRIPMITAMTEIGGIDADILHDKKRLLDFASSSGIQITKTQNIGKIVTKLFDNLVEPRLVEPTFITGYPVEVSPLSRKSDTHPEFTDRFELFIGRREIANGFSELNDPEDQKNRFEQQLEAREQGDKEAHWMDTDYIEALEYAMPPTAGEGIGIDRLTMLLTDSSSIRDVIFFPHMKSRP